MTKENFLKEIGGKSVVEQIVDNITNAILNGDLKPGDKIPTENELCTSMGVGRNSVREAIKILVSYGVVNIRRAEGTFISQGYDIKMLYPVLYGIILQKDSANQVVELRKIMDVGILQLAIDKLTAESLYRAQQALKNFECKLAVLEAENIFAADVEFHMKLVELTENDLLKGICFYVDQITKKSRIKTIKQVLDEQALDKFLLMHKEMLRILEEKDRDSINEVVDNHYQYWKKIK